MMKVFKMKTKAKGLAGKTKRKVVDMTICVPCKNNRCRWDPGHATCPCCRNHVL